MKKKLEAELKSLAHSILKLNDKDDLKKITTKAQEVYQKLSVLSYIDTYVLETPQNKKTVDELVVEHFEEVSTSVDIVDSDSDVVLKDCKIEKVEIEDKSLVVEEEKPEEIEVLEFKPDLKSTLEVEFANTVSLDEASDLFENAKRVQVSKSINDTIMQQKKLQIDLNDRIAFVKNLFENSQEDFNRVISQLNSMETEEDALNFIKLIKKDYDWSNKEVYEERLLVLIERKFS